MSTCPSDFVILFETGDWHIVIPNGHYANSHRQGFLVHLRPTCKTQHEFNDRELGRYRKSYFADCIFRLNKDFCQYCYEFPTEKDLDNLLGFWEMYYKLPGEDVHETIYQDRYKYYRPPGRATF